MSIQFRSNLWLSNIPLWGFPGGSVVKNPPTSAGDLGLIPGSGGSPGEGNGNPPQYSCLGNPKDRGVWQAVHKRVRHDLVTKQQQCSADTRPASLSLPPSVGVYSRLHPCPGCYN